jgi:hypothetical protein
LGAIAGKFLEFLAELHGILKARDIGVVVLKRFRSVITQLTKQQRLKARTPQTKRQPPTARKQVDTSKMRFR